MGALCLAFCASAWADEVVLSNGDHITGSIIKKDGDNLTFKTDRLGTLTVAWNQVQSISSSEPLNVVLQSGRTLQGTLSTANGQIVVTSPGASVTVMPAQIATLRNAGEQRSYERLLNAGWTDLWAGTATIGFAGTKGNAETSTFTAGANATRATNTDKTVLSFSAIKASASIGGVMADTAQAVRGGISYDRNLNSNFFINAFNDYEYDRFQSLDLRFVIGGGAGYHAVKTDRNQLDLLAGLDYNHSSFSTPLTRNALEAYWGDGYVLKLTSVTSVAQSFRMFNDLTNTGNYRVNFDLNAVTKIAKWLTWNVTLSDRYLKDPVPGRKANDFLYSTGIGIAFAR
ncbi:MAG TPA: DUF481 domain-containing protein [Bryobacteraceae bacterium]|nr:DUF481 domain-containing protein [Bryobacteraceae bacterium]